jgi:DeoR family transcriptional regulator of aga operon
LIQGNFLKAHLKASVMDTQNASGLIPAQRRSLILELIRQNGVISVQELSDVIDVSLSTIRRDLAWLAREGAVHRSHGGAALKTRQATTFEPSYQVSSRVAHREKAAIGKRAVERLKAHQSVIFDSSSTVYEAALQVVREGLPLTAVTNDIRIAGLLAECSSIKLIVSGGSLREGSCTLLGEPGATFLRRLHVDVALIGIHAITDATLCDTSTDVAEVKYHMAAAAKRVLVLADAAKFNSLAFCDAIDLRAVDEIITDQRLDSVSRRRLEKQGVHLCIAVPEADDPGSR